MYKNFIITILLISISTLDIVANEQAKNQSDNIKLSKETINLVFPKQNFDFIKSKSSNANYKYFTTDNIYQQNEEIYEIIGMFISKYKSEQNLRIKLRVSRNIDFNQASLNWKTSF